VCVCVRAQGGCAHDAKLVENLGGAGLGGGVYSEAALADGALCGLDDDAAVGEGAKLLESKLAHFHAVVKRGQPPLLLPEDVLVHRQHPDLHAAGERP